MKKPENNVNMVTLLAFIGVIIFAVLEVLSLLTTKNIIKIEGGTFINLLNTIKSICVLVVIGVTAYDFVKDRSKGWIITYIVAMCIIFIATVLAWIL